jgi:hypothetical protein
MLERETMDVKRFDNMARALRATQPRRGVAGLLLGGALGLTGLAESQAKGGGGKGGGKGKGKGGKGKKKNKDKKWNTCTRAAGNCLGSICSVGDYCCSDIDCDCRENLFCRYANPKDEHGACGCLPGEVMHAGRCGFRTGCISAGESYDPATQVCCSGSSHKEGFNDVCDPGVLACNTDGDCTNGSCRGWQCHAPELSCSIYY